MKDGNYYKSKKELLDTFFSINEYETRHYAPASKEWSNSVYTYNKNSTKLYPVLSISILKLIRSYFSMYSRKLERIVRSPRLRMWQRRSSIKRIFVSKAELKHTNDKVVITLYIFNKQKIYYLNKIKRLSLDRRKKLSIFKDLEKFKAFSLKLLKKINKKNMFVETLDWKISELNTFQTKVSKALLKKFLRREVLIMYYKQLLFINQSKFKSTYIMPIKNMIENLYKKKVTFNLVSLKYFQLNSDIFLQLLMLKLRNRRANINAVLNRSMALIKSPRLLKLISLSNIYSKKSVNPLYLINAKDMFSKDILNIALNQSIYFNKDSNTDFTLEKYVQDILSTIRNKTLTGIRVEAKGRLTKRLIATQAVSKMRYVGNLKNIDSSYKQLSSVIFRGNLESNLSYMKSKSKTRIGSYGLKTWINNY